MSELDYAILTATEALCRVETLERQVRDMDQRLHERLAALSQAQAEREDDGR